MSKDYIDIHNHILPGLDDGPEYLSESIEMAKIALKNGINKIVASPHHNEYHQPSKNEILEETDKLNTELKKQSIPVNIYPGNEVRIAPDIIEKLLDKDILTLADSEYVLLEFPFHNIPIFAANIVYEIINNGWTPILAHCERIYDIQQNPRLVDKYISMGCLLQVNSNSITGELGKTSYKTAIEFLKRGQIDIIASDAHSSYDRVPEFQKALAQISKVTGIDKAEAMVSETPAKIFKNLNNH
jgi:protein-tyrosine phosphatase